VCVGTTVTLDLLIYPWNVVICRYVCACVLHMCAYVRMCRDDGDIGSADKAAESSR